jgi:hypothetical protein
MPEWLNHGKFFQADLMFGRPGAYLSGASFDVHLSGLAIEANMALEGKG